MADSYADRQGYGYKLKNRWPITVPAGIALVLSLCGIIADLIGYSEVGGIFIAYTIIVVGLFALFVVIPIRLLDLID